MASSSSPWDTMGEIATVAQLTGLDAVKLIGLIVHAANTARMHKKNCLKFAEHLKLIANLLQQLKISELKKFPETSEPLEQLEDALRRSYVLVNSCKDRSYMYLLAMGWNIANQFKRAQGEIDRYLMLMPLITLVDNSRVRERFEHIEKDQHEYTFDEEFRVEHDMIMNPDANSPSVLKRTLSKSYPQYSFDEALKEENEKLRKELHQSQAKLDTQQSQIIQHLIDVTVAAASMYQAKKASRNASSAHELLSVQRLQHNGWHYGLFDCCSTPCLCLKTCFCPCGRISKIATVANDRYVSYKEVRCIVFPLFLILSCSCYTCCARTKLRRMFNITGNRFDDFLSHCMCCCCALVQEWREVKIRGASSNVVGERTSTRPPSIQVMNSMKD